MNPWPIPKITPKALDFAVKDYGFSTLTADSLSEEPGIENALDILTVDFGKDIGAQVGILSLWDADVKVLSDVSAEIDASNADTTPHELDRAAGAVDQLLSLYLNFLTPTPPPPPTSTPPSNCVVQDFGAINLGTTRTIATTIQNQGSTPITIKDIVIAGNNGPNIFIATPNYTNHVLQPGASIPLNINGDPDGSPQGEKFSSTLTIQTDQPNPQPCLLLRAVAGPGTPSGSGGGGGGGNGGGSSTCHLALQGGQVRCVF